MAGMADMAHLRADQDQSALRACIQCSVLLCIIAVPDCFAVLQSFLQEFASALRPVMSIQWSCLRRKVVAVASGAVHSP